VRWVAGMRARGLFAPGLPGGEANGRWTVGPLVKGIN
jgi:hypothetical protein